MQLKSSYLEKQRRGFWKLFCEKQFFWFLKELFFIIFKQIFLLVKFCLIANFMLISLVSSSAWKLKWKLKKLKQIEKRKTKSKPKAKISRSWGRSSNLEKEWTSKHWFEVIKHLMIFFLQFLFKALSIKLSFVIEIQIFQCTKPHQSSLNYVESSNLKSSNQDNCYETTCNQTFFHQISVCLLFMKMIKAQKCKTIVENKKIVNGEISCLPRVC